MVAIVLIVAWTAILVAAAFVVQKRKQRSLDLLEQNARQLGFSFTVAPEPFACSDLHGLSLLQCDPGAIFDRMMTGKIGDTSAVICDVVCGSEHCRTVNAVTIAAFRVPASGVPVFRIAGRGVLRRMKEVMHPQQLGSESEIGKGLLLEYGGKNVDAFLTPMKLAKLQGCTKGFCIESSSEWVFVYQPCVRVQRKGLLDFIRQVSEIANILFNRSHPAPPSQSMEAVGGTR